MRVAICLMFKDEHKYLKEFIDYHLNLGVDDIIIYDNESKEPIPNYGPRVLVLRWEDQQVAKQQRAYFHCINRFKNDYDWIGFIDTDEFLILKSHRDIKTLLKEYEDFDGLAISWLTFGDSYLENFKSHKEFYMHSDPKLAINEHVKSFIKPKKVGGLSGNFLHNFPCNLVNEHRKPITGPTSYHTRDKVYIKHCFIRTKEAFREKIARGRGDGVVSTEHQKTLENWEFTQKQFNSSQEETMIWSKEKS